MAGDVFVGVRVVGGLLPADVLSRLATGRDVSHLDPGDLHVGRIATDATTEYFFKDLVDNRCLASLYDFENSRPIFEGVHRSYIFCLLTLVGRTAQEPAADFAFFAHHPTDLQRPNTRFTLTPEEITLLNPNTGTCPIFRTRLDAEIPLDIYRRMPILIKDDDPKGNPWNIKFLRMFD